MYAFFLNFAAVNYKPLPVFPANTAGLRSILLAFLLIKRKLKKRAGIPASFFEPPIRESNQILWPGGHYFITPG
jgi:hypothetical protein